MVRPRGLWPLQAPMAPTFQGQQAILLPPPTPLTGCTQQSLLLGHFFISTFFSFPSATVTALSPLLASSQTHDLQTSEYSRDQGPPCFLFCLKSHPGRSHLVHALNVICMLVTVIVADLVWTYSLNSRMQLPVWPPLSWDLHPEPAQNWALISTPKLLLPMLTSYQYNSGCSGPRLSSNCDSFSYTPYVNLTFPLECDYFSLLPS